MIEENKQTTEETGELVRKMQGILAPEQVFEQMVRLCNSADDSTPAGKDLKFVLAGLNILYQNGAIRHMAVLLAQYSEIRPDLFILPGNFAFLEESPILGEKEG